MSQEFIEGRVFLSSVEKIFDEEMSVSDYFRFIGNLKEHEMDYFEETIQKLLRKFDIIGCYNTKIKNLSFATKKKVSILASMIGDNLVIMFDEPFEGLDAGSRRKVANLFKEMTLQERIVIVATNSVDDAQKISDW